MNKKCFINICLIMTLAAILFSCATTGNTSSVSLGEAIEQSAEKITSELPRGSIIAVVAFETNNSSLANYIIGELNGALFDRGIIVVSRQSLEFIERELKFQMSGVVSDETAQSIGKFFGAEFIIVGELRDVGGSYRYRTDTIHVGEARHGSVVRLDVRNDNAMKRMVTTLANQDTSGSAAEKEIREQAVPNTALDFLERGILLAMRSDFDLAIMNFSDALKLNPDLVGAYMLRGRALFASVSNVLGLGENFSLVGTTISSGEVSAEKLEVLTLAVDDFAQAIRLSPNPVRAYIERGSAYLHMGNYNSAMADFNQAIRFDPNYAEGYNSRALVYYQNGNFDRALTDFNQALSLEPAYATAYYNRGLVYTHQGDHERAIIEYTKAIELEPSALVAYNNRGLSYKELGEYELAMADFNWAIDYKSDYAIAYFNRGVIYYDQGDIDRAIEDYTQAIRFNPNYVYAYLNRGVMYTEKGDFDQAITEWEMVLQLDPNNVTARRNIELARELLKN
jgi:tetratricopeptide (TPR) repeat protein